ncbi:MAG: VIT family protein [Burkholderiaceae bacterium]|nr:VIT family protein [Microbacteriaceae bacterium]
MTQEKSAAPAGHPNELNDANLADRLNWLRAAVLGANDGIVSVAAVVVGVAGATSSVPAIATAGIAALVGGAISMALGEYVSVSSQSDSQRALIAKERQELIDYPEEELEELAGMFRAKGISAETAHIVAVELTEKDALRAHLSEELHITEDDVVSAWHAAWVSAVAFTTGAALPLIAMLSPLGDARVPVTFAAVLVALALTGAFGARLGGASVTRSIVRVVVGGAAALAFTFLIGSLLGSSGLV